MATAAITFGTSQCPDSKRAERYSAERGGHNTGRPAGASRMRKKSASRTGTKFETPGKFDLGINLKTATALTIPPTLLLALAEQPLANGPFWPDGEVGECPLSHRCRGEKRA
jgi:hypothetical protein